MASFSLFVLYFGNIVGLMLLMSNFFRSIYNLSLAGLSYEYFSYNRASLIRRKWALMTSGKGKCYIIRNVNKHYK